MNNPGIQNQNRTRLFFHLSIFFHVFLLRPISPVLRRVTNLLRYICFVCLGLSTIKSLDFWYINILHDGSHDLSSNKVRIGIGTGPSVLEVTTSLGLGIPSNSHTSSTVGNTEGEIVNASSLELSSQTQLVALSVNGNVFLVLGTQLVNSLSDDFNSTSLTHSFGRNVGVHTSTVPVTLNDGLGVESAVNLELFTNTLEDVTTHEKLITGINSDAWSNLVFLLSGHDLTVSSRDFNTSIETGTVGGIGDGTSEAVLGTGRAVVWSLRTVGNSILGPAERSALIEVEEGEFLLKTEPDFFIFMPIEGLGGY